MPIEWDPGAPRAPPAQRPDQLPHPGPRERRARPLHFGRAARRRPVVRPSRPGPVPRLRQPGRRSDRPRVPDGRQRRLPDPGPRRSSSPTARPSSTSATSAIGSSPASRRSPGLPSTYVEADDEADTVEIDARRRADRGSRSTLSYTIFRDRAGRRPAAPIRNGGSVARCGSTTAMSAAPRPARRRLGPRPAERARGPASGTSSDAPPRARAASRSEQPARGVEPPARTRSWSSAGAATTEAAGEAYGFSLVYSGNFLAEVEVDPYGDDPGADRDQPRGLRLAPRAGRDVRRARRPSSSTRPPGSARLSDAYHRAVPRAARPRDVARPAAAGPDQQLGGHVLRLRRAEAARDRDRRAGPRDRAVRARRRLVRRARRRHDLARRLVRRPAQAARTASTGWPARIEALGLALRAVDRARDGQPARASCSRAHPDWAIGIARPAADGEPPAARPRPVPARGRRPPLRRRCPRSSAARRSRTSSGT